MTDTDTTVRPAFVHSAEAWWSPAVPRRGSIVDHVFIGDYDDGVGELGEWIVEWHSFRGAGKLSPRVCIFAESLGWTQREDGRAILSFLNDNRDATPEEFCEFLRDLGFADDTERERPCG